MLDENPLDLSCSHKGPPGPPSPVQGQVESLHDIAGHDGEERLGLALGMVFE